MRADMKKKFKNILLTTVYYNHQKYGVVDSCWLLINIFPSTGPVQRSQNLFMLWLKDEREDVTLCCPVAPSMAEN